jgi:hypothetical protein
MTRLIAAKSVMEDARDRAQRELALPGRDPAKARHRTTHESCAKCCG